MTTTTITLTPEHGYALGVAAFSVLFITSLGVRVGGARAKAKIPYPYMYADKAEAEKDELKNKFNCAQRAHQNTLENYPGFLVFFTIAALQHPLIASVSGLVWIAGRYAYASGYCTGDPSKRMRGGFQYFGLLALMYLSFKTAYSIAFAK